MTTHVETCFHLAYWEKKQTLLLTQNYFPLIKKNPLMKFEKNNMKEKVLKNLMELTVMRKTKELKKENFKT